MQYYIVVNYTDNNNIIIIIMILLAIMHTVTKTEQHDQEYLYNLK